MTATASLDDRVERVRSAIQRAAKAAGRSAADVTLVAVTKTVDRPVVDQAVTLGLTHLAENRVQAAAAKFAPPLPAGTTLHLVGQLQTNKARAAVALFDVVESVDRPSLVETLEQGAHRAGLRLPVLLQVNVAREPQKSGCDPDEAASLAARIAGCPNLDLRGLMTIAPLVRDPEEVRPVFRRLRELRDDLARRDRSLDLRTLSMGMTNDFAVAIAEGATHVRIGRAFFGE